MGVFTRVALQVLVGAPGGGVFTHCVLRGCSRVERLQPQVAARPVRDAALRRGLHSREVALRTFLTKRVTHRRA